MASAALKVSISALASSISALMPVWMVWGIDFLSRHSGATRSVEPGISTEFHYIEIPGSRCARPGMTTICYRTSSFIAPSRPSIVIGYMRSENSRRMMVVDSE